MKDGSQESEDLSKATQQIAGHLSALGITLSEDEDVEVIREIANEVERFEEAVESRGGDLMVDEAPPRSSSQPDDPDFALPRPMADESTSRYLERLRLATQGVLKHARPQ